MRPSRVDDAADRGLLERVGGRARSPATADGVERDGSPDSPPDRAELMRSWALRQTVPLLRDQYGRKEGVARSTRWPPRFEEGGSRPTQGCESCLPRNCYQASSSEAARISTEIVQLRRA
jgi:hypothetical protein